MVVPYGGRGAAAARLPALTLAPSLPFWPPFPAGTGILLAVTIIYQVRGGQGLPVTRAAFFRNMHCQHSGGELCGPRVRVSTIH